MHQLVNDHQYRPLSEAVSFNKAREEVHGLAMYLEKCGINTYGENTELYATVKVGKCKYTIYPSWTFNNKIHINIPSLETNFEVSRDSLGKVFKLGSFVVQAISEYQAAMDEYEIKVAPFRQSLKSAETAFKNSITMAEELDNV